MNRFWIVGLASVVACGGGAPEPPVVSDSAGITIVENIDPQWGRSEAWHLSEEPVVNIGDTVGDPNYIFSQITGAVRLADGTIVVGNNGTKELRFYDGTGSYKAVVGGAGGRVEFTAIEWLGRFDANSAIAYDGPVRVSVFDDSGNLQHETSLVLSFQATPGAVRGVFSDSSLMVMRGVSHWVRSMRAEGNSPQGLLRGPASIFRYSHTSGQLINSLGTYAGAERIFKTGRTRIVHVNARPFGRDATVAVWGNDLYVGTQDEYEIRVISAEDSTKALIRVAQENAPVTQEQLDRYKNARMANVHARERADREAELDSLPYPETMPAYGNIIVDTEGNLWVENHRPFAGEQPVWTVFDSSYHMLGTVETPVRLHIFDIGADYVLGRWVGQDRVERIHMYSIEKSSH